MQLFWKHPLLPLYNTMSSRTDTLQHQQRCARFRATDLYVVTAEPLSCGRTDDDVLEAVIAGGATIIQLRDKENDAATFYEKALRFRRRTREAGVLLVINDRVDIACAVDADGVHLGQNDLPIAAARTCGPSLIIGRSTHSVPQACEAQTQGADYVNLGPIYPTRTKEHAATLGCAIMRDAAPHLHIPFTVMGGITREKIPELCAAGARHIALVTAVTQADDMTATVRALREDILRHRTDNTT